MTHIMNALLRTARLGAMVLATSLAFYGVACSSSDTHDHGGETGGVDQQLTDVVFEGGTHHEPLENLIAATAEAGSTQAPVFDFPEKDATLPASTIPTFTWHDGATALLTPAPQKLRARSALLALFGSGVAWAHGAPYNGEAYWLVFTDMDGEPLVRVFTSAKSYTPDATAWAKLSAQSMVHVTITSAIFEQNELTADGGPFAGEMLMFSIER